MIFVTLGTHPQAMDRLVRAIDDLLERHELDEPVYIQAAKFDMRPQHAVALGVIAYPEYERMVREARVVVTHGGPGAILSVLAAGKAPVVMPRDPAHGEHVDDHQLQFCRWLAERRPIRVVNDVEELAMLLRQEAPGAVGAERAGPPADVIERLSTLIESTADS